MIRTQPILIVCLTLMTFSALEAQAMGPKAKALRAAAKAAKVGETRDAAEAALGATEINEGSSQGESGTQASRKKKILVFTDPGGGGHIAASRAIENTLGGLYDIKVITPLEHLPFVSNYNKTQRKGNYNTLRLISAMQPIAELLADHFETREAITKELLTFKPDLVISVIPLVNWLTEDIIKQNYLNIPLLVLVTDLEVKHFFRKMFMPGPTVKVSLPFDDETLKKPLRKFFNDENFISLGFPLRPEFGISKADLEPKISEIRTELGIAENDKIVIIMMGAQGAGKAIVKYTKKITRSTLGTENEKIHVVALCGSNEALRAKTQAIEIENPNIVVHALGVKSGDYVAALMRTANVMVSKPGGGSVNEAFASELYTLYHTQSVWPLYLPELLPWEYGNMQYSMTKKWGEPLFKSVDFIPQLTTALGRPRIEVRQCLGRSFGENLFNYVNELLKPEVKTALETSKN